MSDHTAIEWCDATFNPWRGCTKVSEGCKFCYADTMSHRNPLTLGVWGPKGTRVIAGESYWKQPEKWAEEARQFEAFARLENLPYERPRVFCASLADVFEGPETMPDSAWETVELARLRLWALIEATPTLDWLLLTKRPDNWNKVGLGIDGHGLDSGGFPANVWIGTSVEDQKTADQRIPHLLEIPAVVRFLSCEPLLGPVTLEEGVLSPFDISWVIAGGESGPNARPMHPDWAKSLRDQCQAAGVPFFFKQWGEWTVSDPFDTDDPMTHQLRPASYLERFNQTDLKRGWGPFQIKSKVGKKRAGRLIDGRTWDEFPVVTP